MNFIQLQFFIFLIATWILYFIMPHKFRWMILLISSVFFYCMAGWQKIIFAAATCLIAYAISLLVENVYKNPKYNDLDMAKKKAKAKRWNILGMGVIILLLVYSKIGQELFDAFINYNREEGDIIKIIVPLGISYYTFGIIGYLADVYWQKDKAEKNPLKLLLYMIYFPQILQGPIPRHNKLAKQLAEPQRFDNRKFSFGVQRMLWGYFKKMVIADRFGIMVKTVYSNYQSYEGQIFVAIVLCSVIQLYCDFSGCMDIAIGISETLGITLDENFNRPFFSKTVAEFWRRWHITLGTWFKDYIYMPMVISPKLIAISKKIKDKFGVKAAKRFMAIVPLSVVWILTGLWHGTGKDYIIWGCYWGLLIILSTIFAQELKNINKKLGIDANSVGWKRFQMVRTFVFFSIARVVTGPGKGAAVKYIVKSMLTKFNMHIWFDRTLFTLGVDRQDFWVGIAAIMLLWFISLKQEKGVKIRESIASCPLPIRWLIYYGAFFAVLIFGIYGPGYNASDFVYMKF